MNDTQYTDPKVLVAIQTRSVEQLILETLLRIEKLLTPPAKKEKHSDR